MTYKDIVSNVKIYDLEESLIASGYPMRTIITERQLQVKDVERGKKLFEATFNGNKAHAQFLTGIRVNFDLTFSNKAWIEAERYRFLEFVSSQSTMHRITKFALDNSYIEYTDPRIIKIMKELVDQYNTFPSEENYLKILYSNPAGFKLTARMATNYRCLGNIYLQRRTHRLPEWRLFCEWIETLPYAKELLIQPEN